MTLGEPWPYNWPWSTYPPQNWTWTVPHCEHCWCEEHSFKPDHAVCCKCRTEMHKKFIPKVTT